MRRIRNIRDFLGTIDGSAYHHATPDDPAPGLGLGNVDVIELWIGELLQHLHRPESEWKEACEFRFDFETVCHAIRFLKAFFQNATPSNDDRLTAKIFAKFLYVGVPNLEAKYLDDSA